MENATKTGLILVFRPHQRPAWADYFSSREAVVGSWINGEYDRQVFANFEHYMTETYGEDTPEKPWPKPSFDDAVSDLQHDLNCLTILETPQEAIDYIAGKNGSRHNRGTGAVETEAACAGWIESENDDSDE
jgi:hypothetical protein